MPTGKQIRAARILAGWDAETLALKVGLSRVTIQNIENGVNKRPLTKTMEKIVLVFDQAGFEFTDYEGIRKKPTEVEIFAGADRFQIFIDQMYAYLREHPVDVCISVTDERRLQAAFKSIEYHRTVMRGLVEIGVTGRVLAAAGDFKRGGWAEIRKRHVQDNMPQVSFFAYGDCLALISLEHNPSPYVVLHKTGPFAAEYRQVFNSEWDLATKL